MKFCKLFKSPHHKNFYLGSEISLWQFPAVSLSNVVNLCPAFFGVVFFGECIKIAGPDLLGIFIKQIFSDRIQNFFFPNPAWLKSMIYKKAIQCTVICSETWNFCYLNECWSQRWVFQSWARISFQLCIELGWFLNFCRVRLQWETC